MTFPFLFEFDEPRDAIVHHARVERVNDKLAPPLGEDEIGLFEQIKVVRNRRLADLEMVGNRPGGKVPAPQQIQNRPPRPIVQGLENQIEHFDI